MVARAMLRGLLRTKPTAGTVPAPRCLSTIQRSRPGSIDVHTHMYLPRYMAMLRARSDVPRVALGTGGDERLIILPGEDNEKTTAAGRPIGKEYYQVEAKLAFMDRHDIDISVVSLANPWLDFLSCGADAVQLAREINDELQETSVASCGRIYGFGVVALQEGVAEAVKEVERLSKMSGMRGIILGTRGLGRGLDDERMDPLYEALQRLGLVAFVHPHYGVGNEHFGDAGHSLFLALGFPFETTVAISRLILAGVLDRYPGLKLLLAHAGGTLPFLAGRLDSCVSTDLAVAGRLQHPPSTYLRRLYYDAVIYHRPGLEATVGLVGAAQLMFGTDHPFFPPSSGPLSEDVWPSTVKNYDMMEGLDYRDAVLRDNAARLLNLPLS